jgi:predicted metal-dependent peptidase
MATALRTTCTADAAIRLMLKFPFWCELYYSMTVIEDASIPTLATDGVNMWVNPEFWRGLTLELKISALAHEITHKMLHHPTRCQHRDGFIFNVAGDILVNGLLVENNFPIAPSWIQPVPKYRGWTVEAVYDDIIKNLPPPPKGGGGGQGKGKPGSQPQQGAGSPGEDDSPYANAPGIPESWKKAWRDIRKFKGTPQEVENQEAKTEQQVANAIAAAKAMGNLPAGVEMAVEKVFTVPEEPWYNHLQRYMQSLAISQYNWSRINKRMAVLFNMVAPSNYHEALGEVVLFVDCSGSCYTAAEQANFAGHINAILAEAKPQKVHVAYFDTKVHKHEELEPGSIEFESHPTGGGGTSFADLFTWAEDEGISPAVAIVLTDMMGTFPSEEPGFPVIWCNVYDANTRGPFGDTIHVK